MFRINFYLSLLVVFCLLPLANCSFFFSSGGKAGNTKNEQIQFRQQSQSRRSDTGSKASSLPPSAPIHIEHERDGRRSPQSFDDFELLEDPREQLQSHARHKKKQTSSSLPVHAGFVTIERKASPGGLGSKKGINREKWTTVAFEGSSEAKKWKKDEEMTQFLTSVAEKISDYIDGLVEGAESLEDMQLVREIIIDDGFDRHADQTGESLGSDLEGIPTPHNSLYGESFLLNDGMTFHAESTLQTKKEPDEPLIFSRDPEFIRSPTAEASKSRSSLLSANISREANSPHSQSSKPTSGSQSPRLTWEQPQYYEPTLANLSQNPPTLNGHDALDDIVLYRDLEDPKDPRLGLSESEDADNAGRPLVRQECMGTYKYFGGSLLNQNTFLRQRSYSPFLTIGANPRFGSLATNVAVARLEDTSDRGLRPDYAWENN